MQQKTDWPSSFPVKFWPQSKVWLPPFKLFLWIYFWGPFIFGDDFFLPWGFDQLLIFQLKFCLIVTCKTFEILRQIYRSFLILFWQVQSPNPKSPNPLKSQIEKGKEELGLWLSLKIPPLTPPTHPASPPQPTPRRIVMRTDPALMELLFLGLLLLIELCMLSIWLWSS